MKRNKQFERVGHVVKYICVGLKQHYLLQKLVEVQITRNSHLSNDMPTFTLSLLTNILHQLLRRSLSIISITRHQIEKNKLSNLVKLSNLKASIFGL
jgi:hypothetical protein